jgi:hypothetical protein
MQEDGNIAYFRLKYCTERRKFPFEMKFRRVSVADVRISKERQERRPFAECVY